MKYLLIAFALQLGCTTTQYEYQIHLVGGGGYHHLITVDTEDEAWDFIDEQENSHGTMKIIKKSK